jgi:pyruvate dehydrogenase E2 component (dihydrolipoamide acetyltransferase)
MKPETERIEKLDFVERWLRDGLSVIDPPGGFLTLEVDMSNVKRLRGILKEAGTPVTYTHVLLKAAASALTKHRELHRLIAGNRRLLPGTVDICLSIAGDLAVTPVLIVRDAGRKGLAAIADEVRDRAAQARSEDEKRLGILRRWGWLVPAAFLRRALIRFLLNRLWYRRMASGTFQVSVVSTVDHFVPFLFNTSAALGAGRIRDKVVAVNGQIEIRPILVLACCFDHNVWNGMDAATFLCAVKEELERGPS